MSGLTFVWAHDLLSSVDHENVVGVFDWRCAEDTAQVVRYDARGHGSGMVQYVDRAYRWSALVDDMLRMAGDGPFVAGGCGMGAATALLAAACAPRRLAALVLAAPPAGWQWRDEKAAQYEELAHAVALKGAVTLAERWPVVGQPEFLLDGFSGPAELITRHLFAMDPRALPYILRGAAASDLPDQDQVHEIIVPTLILSWTGDAGHPVPVAQELSSLMIQNELHLADSRDDLAKWPALVRDFLAGV
ncbi:MAG TPA: alpha/beta fold hydrolase [Acidimicrobiales bacterium]|jgi:pimeloyl-ACP methyl ester carboxylesterase|nr:alpha/beta fold hydrolase [Acidimicrobiales bacterium]